MSDRQTSDEGARKTRTAQSPRSGRSAVRATERSEVNTPSDYRVIEELIFWRRSRSVELTPAPPPDRCSGRARRDRPEGGRWEKGSRDARGTRVKRVLEYQKKNASF